MTRYLAAPAYVLGLMAVTVGPWLISPYPGKYIPGTYVEAAQVDPSLDFPIKDQSRVDPLPVRRVTPELYARLDPPIRQTSVSHVHAESSLPWSCETIRAATEKLSKQQIARLARLYRLNDKQLSEARRCLHEKKAKT